MEGLHVGEGFVGGNQSRASLRGLRRREREHRKEQQHMHNRHETRVDSDGGSSHGERRVSYILERHHRSDRLRELENLRKQVNDLEIELRGRNRRRDQEDSFDDPDYIANDSF